jgi:hypothetical protein
VACVALLSLSLPLWSSLVSSRTVLSPFVGGRCASRSRRNCRPGGDVRTVLFVCEVHLGSVCRLPYCIFRLCLRALLLWCLGFVVANLILFSYSLYIFIRCLYCVNNYICYLYSQWTCVVSIEAQLTALVYEWGHTQETPAPLVVTYGGSSICIVPPLITFTESSTYSLIAWFFFIFRSRWYTPYFWVASLFVCDFE